MVPGVVGDQDRGTVGRRAKGSALRERTDLEELGVAVAHRDVAALHMPPGEAVGQVPLRTKEIVLAVQTPTDPGWPIEVLTAQVGVRRVDHAAQRSGPAENLPAAVREHNDVGRLQNDGLRAAGEALRYAGTRGGGDFQLAQI